METPKDFPGTEPNERSKYYQVWGVASVQAFRYDFPYPMNGPSQKAPGGESIP